MSESVAITTVKTQPFQGQKPGTSGLRKKVKVFEQAHYLENFIQATFDALAPIPEGAELVVSGDGRYHNDKAVITIIRMAAANGFASVVVGQNFLMSTPAVSALVRKRKALGAIILTASHNPGGPGEDFGVKYNIGSGGPAPESVTDRIYANTQAISQYHIAQDTPVFDAGVCGETAFAGLTITVVDAATEYVNLMQTLFDFPRLSAFLKRGDVSVLFDAMHGVAGPFAHAVFKALGCQEDGTATIMNGEPLEDFGGGHPDPNLTYAHELVNAMGLGGKEHQPVNTHPTFGAAADGDADRNMILGSRFFVTPSDSVAIIAANAKDAIPYFKDGLKGLARSMPTSGALDRVAAKLGVTCYEVPTGWKFFGNLMDAGRLSICGEESFGTGSDHIREKDGIWAVLAWLSILCHRNENGGQAAQPQQPLVSVEDVVTGHWKEFGRNYYTRYDYEQVDSDAANALMANLVTLTEQLTAQEPPATLGAYTIASADEFSYNDPVDASTSLHQGIRFIFTDGSRIVFRLSGTGSVGATIRLYVEKYEGPEGRLMMATAEAVKDLVAIALQISEMEKRTGRNAPTVIT